MDVKEWPMKQLIASLALLSACAISSQARATGLTVAHFEPNVVPVLVKVDKEGAVTSVFAAERLRPAIDRMLYRNARDVVVKQEDASYSRMLVLRMKLDARPRDDGAYDARFVVIEAKPVPSGSWFWLRQGDRYALVDGNRLPHSQQNFERSRAPMQRWSPPVHTPAPPPSPAPSVAVPRT